MSQFASVKDYGATGDGSTDDRAAIQHAVDDLGSSGGGALFFPVGTYMVSLNNGQGIAYDDNIRFVGEHRDVTTIKLVADQGNGHVFNGTGKTNIAFENLTIDGNRDAYKRGASTGHCLRGRYVNGFYVCRCRIKNARYYGIGLQRGAGDPDPQPEKNVHLVDVVVEKCGGWSEAGPDRGDGIDIKYGTDIHCVNVEVSNCAQRGFDLRGRRMFLSNVKAIANGSTGINCRGNSSSNGADIANPPHFMLSNVYADSNGETGVVIFQDNGKDEGRVVVTACLSQSNGHHGIDIPRGGSHPTLTCLSGCLARNNALSGIHALEDNVTVNGCQMVGNGGWGFDNGGRDLRHVAAGNIALFNSAGQIRGPGARAVHANNTVE